MRHVASNVLTLLIVAMLAVVLAIQEGQRAFEAPGPLAEARIVTIERGDTMSQAAERLADAGVLPESAVWGLLDGAGLFRLGMRYTRQGAVVKAGEYRIPARAALPEVLDLVTSGRSIQFPITVPEGLSSWQVVELLKGNDVLTGEIERVPEEGTLAPDTYLVERGTARAEVIRRMEVAQRRILAEAWDARDDDLPIETAQEALILASIIEKETGQSDERTIVASVFVNRLRRGMRLETDPTVIYGITRGEGSLGRGLRRSELVQPTPWNTYRIPGLPPTPIANPGRAAIKAAVNPADSPYYFFVADGTGGHAFAETLTEHNANVAVWRRIEAARRAGQATE
ncbi:MAG: endolytic transglycosylase MltG [Pseudomonadota bacterium]